MDLLGSRQQRSFDLLLGFTDISQSCPSSAVWQLCCRLSSSAVAAMHTRLLLWLNIQYSALLSSPWLQYR